MTCISEHLLATSFQVKTFPFRTNNIVKLANNLLKYSKLKKFNCVSNIAKETLQFTSCKAYILQVFFKTHLQNISSIFEKHSILSKIYR